MVIRISEPQAFLLMCLLYCIILQILVVYQDYLHPAHRKEPIMQKNIIQDKRLESHRLIEKYMLSSSQKEKQDIRKQIHDIWDQVRLLALEEKLTK